MHKHLRDAKEAEKNLKSNKPKILAFLPLIACHFKEMNLATFIVSIYLKNLLEIKCIFFKHPNS